MRLSRWGQMKDGDYEYDPFKKGVVPIWFIVLVVIPLGALILSVVLLPAQ